MDQSILEAITKSLPAMQMDALRKELEKADRYEGLAKEKEALRLEGINLAGQIMSLKDTLAKHAALDAKTLEIEKRERNLELEMLKAKLSYESQSRNEIKELAYAAFRNPTVTKSYSRHVGVPSGGYTNVVSESERVEQE